MRILRSFAASASETATKPAPLSFSFDKLYLCKVKSTHLTFIEAKDLSKLIRELSAFCPHDLQPWFTNSKRILTSAQILDAHGVIDSDFTLVKPLTIEQQKILPRTNQLLVETAASEKRKIVGFLKELDGKIQVYDMSRELFSYRLFVGLSETRTL